MLKGPDDTAAAALVPCVCVLVHVYSQGECGTAEVEGEAVFTPNNLPKLWFKMVQMPPHVESGSASSPRSREVRDAKMESSQNIQASANIRKGFVWGSLCTYLYYKCTNTKHIVLLIYSWATLLLPHWLFLLIKHTAHNSGQFCLCTCTRCDLVFWLSKQLPYVHML